MRKLLLFSAGALVLAGCDFTGDSGSVSAPIASVQASGLPGTSDPDGSGPDIFFEIQDIAGRSFYRSAIVSDVDSAQTAQTAVSGTVSIPSSTMPLQIAVYDFDDSFNGSQLMARSTTFTADQVAATPQITVGSRDSASPTQFTVVRGSVASE